MDFFFNFLKSVFSNSIFFVYFYGLIFPFINFLHDFILEIFKLFTVALGGPKVLQQMVCLS